jgi:hypothetical protein
MPSLIKLQLVLVTDLVLKADARNHNCFLYGWTIHRLSILRSTNLAKPALIGSVITQHPDFCKVALPEAGVMDMLRFQKFTAGWGWVQEYGSSGNVAICLWLPTSIIAMPPPPLST